MTTGMIIGRVLVWFQMKLETESRTALRIASVPPRVVERPLLDGLQHGGRGIGGECIVDGERHAATGELDGVDLLALERDDGDRGDHAVVCELLTVAKHDGIGVADAKSVDVDDAAFDRRTALHDAAAHLERVAVVHDEDVLAGDSQLAPEARVGAQVDSLAVDRHEVRWVRHGEHKLELFLAAVTGDVDERAVLVVHVAADSSPGC